MNEVDSNKPYPGYSGIMGDDPGNYVADWVAKLDLSTPNGVAWYIVTLMIEHPDGEFVDGHGWYESCVSRITRLVEDVFANVREPSDEIIFQAVRRNGVIALPAEEIAALKGFYTAVLDAVLAPKVVGG